MKSMVFSKIIKYFKDKNPNEAIKLLKEVGPKIESPNEIKLYI